MRFRCENPGCSAEITGEDGFQIGNVQLVNATTGEVTPIPMGTTRIRTICPFCGGEAVAVNQHVVTDKDGYSILGFVEGPADVAALSATLAELRQWLPEDASADQIADFLEERDERLKPIAQYVRDHQAEISAIGTLLSVVIALLAWLMPRGQDEQPPPTPTGISVRDLERLAEELREATSTPTAEPSQSTGHAGDNQRKERQGKTARSDSHRSGDSGQADAEPDAR